MNERYALHHEGTWFYYLSGDALSAEVLADGVPMTGLGNTHRAGWWAADHEATVITLRKPRHPLTLSYRLRDPSTESERFPATLSTQDYQDRSGDDDDVFWRLYEPVTQEQEPEVTAVEGPWLRLDGEPPADDGRSWKANLPYALANRREYLHLFPGYMPGFREHMQEIIKALPHVRHVFEAKRGTLVYGLEVTLEVPFDQPVTEYRPARNRDGSPSRSRAGRTVPKMATRKLDLPVPYRIDGPDRATAAAEWDRREADLLAVIEGASVAACAACGGCGYVPTDAGVAP